MNKHLDYWMNKLGYRKTHWTDEIKDGLYLLYLRSTQEANNNMKMTTNGYQVTLSVKKMKK